MRIHLETRMLLLGLLDDLLVVGALGLDLGSSGIVFLGLGDVVEPVQDE